MNDVVLMVFSVSGNPFYNTKEMAEHDSQVRRICHDIRHHLFAVEEMINTQQYEQAGQYRQKNDEGLAQAVVVDSCENMWLFPPFCIDIAIWQVKTTSLSPVWFHYSKRRVLQILIYASS